MTDVRRARFADSRKEPPAASQRPPVHAALRSPAVGTSRPFPRALPGLNGPEQDAAAGGTLSAGRSFPFPGPAMIRSLHARLLLVVVLGAELIGCRPRVAVEPARLWNKVSARLRRLDELFRRLAALEKRVGDDAGHP